MKIEDVRQALIKYIPEEAIDLCTDWIAAHKIALRITKSRSSKYGDYRPPAMGRAHRISINHDMNKYAFLITFTHEIAHLTTYNKTKSLKEPHGDLWKKEFKKLMHPFLSAAVFPDDLAEAVRNYIHNPAATSCADHNMMRVLKKYDKNRGEWLNLEELALNTKFRIKTGRTFIKGKLLSKNYVCVDAKTKYKYTLNPLMEVQPV